MSTPHLLTHEDSLTYSLTSARMHSPKAKAETEAKAKAQREAKAQAEREAKSKAEREAKAKAKAEREAKAKAEREAKAQAEREAKAQAEREAKAKAERLAKEKANTTTIEKSQSEFDQLLRPYAEGSEIGRDDIDDELADAQVRMAKLRDKSRHETPEGAALQQKVTEFKRLVELRKVLVGHPALLHAPRIHCTADVASISAIFTHPCLHRISTQPATMSPVPPCATPCYTQEYFFAPIEI